MDYEPDQYDLLVKLHKERRKALNEKNLYKATQLNYRILMLAQKLYFRYSN